MKREALPLIARRTLVLIAVWAAVLVLISLSYRVSAQKHTSRQESSHPASIATSAAKVTKVDATVDAENDYSKKIKEYTTETYFRTELVDHLPMSDKVPSPDKVLGYVIGAPNKLTYSKDLYRYYRELAGRRHAFASSARRRNPRKAKNRCWWQWR